MGFCTTKCRRFLLSAGRKWCCRNMQLSVVFAIYRGGTGIVQYYPINVIRYNEHHLHNTLGRAGFLWTRRTGMFPFILLAFLVWLVWESPGFVHCDDLSKKVLTSPLVISPTRPLQLHSGAIVAPRKFHRVSNALQVSGRVQCGAQFCDILRLPLLIHPQSIGDQHPTGKQEVELCYSPRGVVLYGGCSERHRAIWQRYIAICFTQSLKTFLIQEHCSSFVKYGVSTLALSLWKSMFYTLH